MGFCHLFRSPASSTSGKATSVIVIIPPKQGLALVLAETVNLALGQCIQPVVTEVVPNGTHGLPGYPLLGSETSKAT